MFSPQIRYLSAFLTLPVTSVEAAGDWYRDALGFNALAGGADGARPWLHIRRAEGQDLVLVGSERRRQLRLRALRGRALGLLRLPSARPALCLAVDQDLASAVERATGEGARRLRPRRSGRDVESARLLDPHGYEWVLFSRLPGGGRREGR